jgi:hypothetical protein
LDIQAYNLWAVSVYRELKLDDEIWERKSHVYSYWLLFRGSQPVFFWTLQARESVDLTWISWTLIWAKLKLQDSRQAIASLSKHSSGTRNLGWETLLKIEKQIRLMLIQYYSIFLFKVVALRFCYKMKHFRHSFA